VPYLIAVLLTAGTMLAGFGTAGFCLVATTAPTRADLEHARHIATAGRWAVALGVLLLWASPISVGGITGIAVTFAICTAVLSLLTKSPLRISAVA
jgi:hypothetical protein